MSSSDQPPHVSSLQRHLARLIEVDRPRLQQMLAGESGKDLVDVADRDVYALELEALDRRIDWLRHRTDPPEHLDGTEGTLQPGALLLLDFGDGPAAYRYSPVDLEDGVEIVTPASPLGTALRHARAGERVEYLTPRGRADVVLLSTQAHR